MYLPAPQRRILSLQSTIATHPVELKCSSLYYPVSDNKHAITLVFTHGIAAHKEQFHPTILRLLSHYHTRPTIRDIWVIDFPNHGESALLNRPTLDAHKTTGQGVCTTADFESYFRAFLSSPCLKDSSVVVIAHSGSCTSWVLALTSTHPCPIPISIIMVEPTLMFPSLSPTDPRSIHGASNVRASLAKRDRWPNKQALEKWVTSRKGIWRKWDKRVLHSYIRHGVQVLDDPQNAANSYVTPVLRKDEESPLYACLSHTVVPESLARACRTVTDAGRGVHVVWAEYEEFISKSAREEILDAAEHRVVSQRIITGAGHLVLQEKPDALGDALAEIISEIMSGPGPAKRTAKM